MHSKLPIIILAIVMAATVFAAGPAVKIQDAPILPRPLASGDRIPIDYQGNNKAYSATVDQVRQYVEGQIAADTIGPPGEKGDPGVGVPPGGEPGQLLGKDSEDDYDFTWKDPPPAPINALTSTSSTDPLAANQGRVLKGMIDNKQDTLRPGVDYLTPTGNAASADKLLSPVNINGVSFDGSTDITVSDTTREPIIPTGTSEQYIRGDKTLALFPAQPQGITCTQPGYHISAYTSSTGEYTCSADVGGSGGGDMYKAIYDPTGKNASPFERTNHTGTQSADTITDGTTNKAYTAAERTKLTAITGTNTGDETQATIKTKLGPATNSVDGYLTATDHVSFANGASLAAAAAPKTRTVNGKALTTDITITASDVGVAAGTTAGTFAAGDDSRITGAAPKDNPTFTGTANFAAIGATGNIQSTGGGVGVLRPGTTATQVDGIQSVATTAATSSNPVRVPPRVIMTGKVWNTSGTPSSNSDNWTMEANPVSGASPSSTLTIRHDLNGAGYTTAVSITDSGNISANGFIGNGSQLTNMGKAQVGLPNVDNTSDANKPVSTAQQVALDLKAPKDNPTFTTGITTPAIIPSSPDGTWRMNVRNTVPRAYIPQEGDIDTDVNGKLWIYHNGAYEEKAPIATSSVFGISKPGNTLTITNGVLDVMLSSLGSSGLVTAGLSGDATIRKGFAYVAASTGKWTFANYSSGTTTLFSNYSGTVCAATSGGLNIKNPVTFANRTSSCAKVWAGTDATFRSIGDGKYWVTSNRNLTKQTGAASGTGGGGGGGGTRTTKPSYGTQLDTNNDLYASLVNAWAFNEGGGTTIHDSVTGTATTISGGVLDANGFTTDATGTGAMLPTPTALKGSAVTLVWGGRILSNGVLTGNPVFVGTSYNAANDSPWIGLSIGRVNGAPATLRTAFNIAGTYNDNNVTGTFTTGNDYSLATTYGAGTLTTYVGGTSVATQSVPSISYGTGSNLQIQGHWASSAYNVGARGSYCLTFNRVLTPTELASIASNPWQFWSP